MKKVILVDGNNLLFRSFYATSYSGNIMRNGKGFPTNALYGFINMMNKIIKEESPNYILVAFDKGKTFRHDKYDDYKAGRQAMPEELKLQFPKAKEVLDTMGIKHFEIDNYEADDIIGTLAKIVDEEDQFIATIVSSDKDLLQLISDEVIVKLLKQSGHIMMDKKEFRKTYKVDPIKMIDLKSLMGDPSDHIPGVKGIGEKTAIPDKLQEAAETLAQQGKTPLLFMSEAKLAGIIAVADTIKADSPEAISELRNMGIRVIMLTGDNERTARAIGDQAGVDEVIAGVLPGGKEDVIRSLKKYGKTAMVGDGINDAPALTRADVGIAIGAGADVAVDAADVVLMKNTLADVPAAIRLSRGVLKNIHENLFWAFFYNAIGIPLAAGCFAALGLTLNPMFGAAAMSLSSFCVVMNALRLNLYKIYDAGHDKKRRHSSEISETGAGDVCTMKIKGMMCTHCEATVRNALEALGEVKSAEVSHEDGVAVVELAGAADSKKLKKAVETAGYKVISIK